MYNRIIYSDNSVNLSGSYLGISCHKLAASGGKYKFISGKYFVSETWIFFFFFFTVPHALIQNRAKRPKCGQNIL